MDFKLRESFVGKNYTKFKKKVFSLPAFFFGALYFAYRKMLVHAIILSVLINLITALTLKFSTGGMTILIFVCINLSIGLYFPLLYRSYYQKTVKKLVEKNPSATEDQLCEAAHNIGGTSITLVLLFIVINAVLFTQFNSYINQTEYTNTINTSETVIDTNQVENTSTIKNEEALPTGPATILKDQKITGYESDCVYLLDFKSTNYDQAVKYSCNEDLINTLKIVFDYNDEIILEARTFDRNQEFLLTSFKLFNAKTGDEIKNITDENSLRIALDLKPTGTFEEILTLHKHPLSLYNNQDTVGYKSVVNQGLESCYTNYNLLFFDENNKAITIDYEVKNNETDRSIELIENQKYNVKYSVEKTLLTHEFTIIDFSIIPSEISPIEENE